MLERRAIIARRLMHAARTAIHSKGSLICLSVITVREQRKEELGETCWVPHSCPTFLSWLAGGLHNQDHTRAQGSNVLIVALQGGDGGFVGCGNGIQGFARLHLVAQYASLLCRVLVRCLYRSPCRFGCGTFDAVWVYRFRGTPARSASGGRG